MKTLKIGSDLEIARLAVAQWEDYHGELKATHSGLKCRSKDTGEWFAVPRGELLAAIMAFDGVWVTKDDYKQPASRVRLTAERVRSIEECTHLLFWKD